MHSIKEAKELAHNIILGIERGDDLSQMCLQCARLALLLNNQDKADSFTRMAEKVVEAETFLETYGSLIKKTMQHLELDDIYDPISSQRSTIDNMRNIALSLSSAPWKYRDPQQDIQTYTRSKRTTSETKTTVYTFAMNKYYSLEFTQTSIDIFENYRIMIENKLPDKLPDSRNQLDSITKNLASDNSTDWSNAVHTCRKILQDLSNASYPPESIISNDIQLGPTNYINRLMAYIEMNSDSKKFKQITGSNLKYIGERLDAVYEASNKGSHQTITTKDEAQRHVIYTYLFLGDILTL